MKKLKNKLTYQMLIGIYVFFCIIMIICGTQKGYTLLTGGFIGIGIAIIAAILCGSEEDESEEDKTEDELGEDEIN